MLTIDQIETFARKASEGETGARNFTCDRSWLQAFAQLIANAQVDLCVAACEQERLEDAVDCTEDAAYMEAIPDCVRAVLETKLMASPTPR